METHPGSKFFSFTAGVVDTGDKPLLSSISSNFRQNLNREKEGRVEEESTMRKEGEEGQSTDSEAKF
jgi:hypothetical protein